MGGEQREEDTYGVRLRGDRLSDFRDFKTETGSGSGSEALRRAVDRAVNVEEYGEPGELARRVAEVERENETLRRKNESLRRKVEQPSLSRWWATTRAASRVLQVALVAGLVTVLGNLVFLFGGAGGTMEAVPVPRALTTLGAFTAVVGLVLLVLSPLIGAGWGAVARRL